MERQLCGNEYFRADFRRRPEAIISAVRTINAYTAGDFVRTLMNQLVIEIADALLILIMRTGASVSQLLGI